MIRSFSKKKNEITLGSGYNLNSALEMQSLVMSQDQIDLKAVENLGISSRKGTVKSGPYV
jgi:hypothetical protein